jgi:hypothetical protein
VITATARVVSATDHFPVTMLATEIASRTAV